MLGVVTAGMNWHPDTEWGEVCELVAMSFSGYEQQLDEMIKDYGVVFDDHVLELLTRACELASEGKHHVTFVEGEGPVVDPDGCDMAESFHAVLKEAAETARLKLRQKAGLGEQK